MNEALQNDLLRSLSRFKKTSLLISNHLINEMQSELNISEIFALTCVKEQGCSDKTPHTAHDAMRSTLSVSKAAISQTLGGLEKKGYVEREIDRDNRRKIVVTLTDTGKSALEQSTGALNKLVESLINGFGEAETSTLISLINSFAELVERLDEETQGDL